MTNLRATSFRLLALAAVLAGVPSACTSNQRWASLGGTPAAEQGVYEAVVRYIHAYYDPPSWNPAPVAWCLATDRRSSQVMREREAADRMPWSPPPRLLVSLGDLEPPVRPVEECGRNDDDEERLVDGGGPAVLLALSHPRWESAEMAWVEARTRQDRRASNRFTCRLARTVDAWRVLECL